MSGVVERLTTAPQGETHVPESWSPDGRHLLFSVIKGSRFALQVLSIEDRKVEAYGGVESAEPIGAVFSPDGRWIAYASSPGVAARVGSNMGVYLQPFPATGARYQVPKQSLDFHPVWGPKGTELFYVPSGASGQMAATSVTTEPAVSFGSPVSLPARVTARRISTEMRAHDILPDGRLVGLVPAEDPESTGAAAPPDAQMRVVINWFEELKARVPVN